MIAMATLPLEVAFLSILASSSLLGTLSLTIVGVSFSPDMLTVNCKRISLNFSHDKMTFLNLAMYDPALPSFSSFLTKSVNSYLKSFSLALAFFRISFGVILVSSQ